MRKVILLLIAACSLVAHAECYMTSGFRADSRNMMTFGENSNNPNDWSFAGEPRDIRRAVTPHSEGRFMCTVLFRVPVNGKWMDAKGQAVGKNTEPQEAVCGRALNLKHAEILVRDANAIPIAGETQMFCTDLPDRKVRIVQVGELVFESEVEPIYGARYGNYPQQPFSINGVEHKFFIERQGQPPNFRTLVGVMRRAEGGPSGRWQVLDKF